MSLDVFEADLLATFLKSKKKFVKFSGRIKEAHFRNTILKFTYKIMSDYFSKYKKIPTASVFRNELLKTTFSSEEKKRYYNVIKKLYSRKIKTSLKYIEENVEDKIEESNLLLSIEKALVEIEKGNLNRAKKELTKRIVLGDMHPGDIQRVLRDWESRQVIRKELSKIPLHERFISTPYKEINIVTQGIQKSEAATIAGLTGLGKSILVGEFGVHSLLETLNVLHFPLENTGEQTAQRYDSRLSEIEYDTIKLYKFNKMEMDQFNSTFKGLLASYKNDVVIRETIGDETDIISIDNTVESLKLDGFNVDFLIIDSCDIMKAVKDYKDYRLDRTSIYWDFKFYCKAKRLPGLTTTQLVKSVKGRIGTVEDLAEAYDKARILDLVYIASQTKDDFKSNIITFSLDKNRDGPGGISIKLFKDSAKMKFLEIK